VGAVTWDAFCDAPEPHPSTYAIPSLAFGIWRSETSPEGPFKWSSVLDPGASTEMDGPGELQPLVCAAR
jgi:hypothetical protein